MSSMQHGLFEGAARGGDGAPTGGKYVKFAQEEEKVPEDEDVVVADDASVQGGRPRADGAPHGWLDELHALMSSTQVAQEEEKVPEDKDGVIADDATVQGGRPRADGVTRRAPRTPGGLPLMRRMSTVSRMFDKGGKGYLTKPEKGARAMAGKDGNIDKDAVVRLVEQNRKMRLWLAVIVVLSLGLVVGLVVTNTNIGGNINKSTETTQSKILEAVNTKVEEDDMGTPHLMDKATGIELTTRAEGDAFKTETKVDPTTGRKLVCVDINQVAKMVNDISTGVQGSLVMYDEQGIQNEMIPINGKFKDHHSYLQFEGFNISLDDDACERGINMSPDYPLDTSDLEAIPIGDNETSTGTPKTPKDDENYGSTRRLRNPTLGKKPRPTSRATATNLPERRATALEKNHQTYVATHTAIREGREAKMPRVDTDYTQSDDTSSARADIFQSTLRNAAPRTKTVRMTNARASKTKASDVLQRHRLEYAMAHAAIRDGRHLEGLSSVPLVTSTEPGRSINILVPGRPDGVMAMAVQDCTSNGGYPRLVLQSPNGSMKQEFYIQGGQIISKLCPEMSIHIHINYSVPDPSKCANGNYLTLRSNTGTVRDDQKWTFEDNGSIESKLCPGQVLSVLDMDSYGDRTRDDVVLWTGADTWNHKWMMNDSDTGSDIVVLGRPGGVMAMAVEDCISNGHYPRVVLQPPNGRDNQQFYVHGDQITSKLCPHMSVSIYGGQCKNGSMIALRSKTRSAEIPENQKWIFEGNGRIVSKSCPGYVLSVLDMDSHGDRNRDDVVLWAEAGTWNHEWKINAATNIDLPERPDGVMAMAVQDCTSNGGYPRVVLQPPNGRDNQQFYVHGDQIISKLCPGMSIHIYINYSVPDPSKCTNGNDLTLRSNTGTVRDDQKWIFEGNGSIESKLCPGKVLSVLDMDSYGDRNRDDVVLWEDQGTWNHEWKMNGSTQDGVSIIAWTHSNGSIVYFQFDLDEWRRYFGSFTHGETRVVRQYRDGKVIGSGTVIVWDDPTSGPTGRWDDRTHDQTIRYWLDGDVIAKPTVAATPDHRLLCGMKRPSDTINYLLNPPIEIQDIMAIALGVSYGVGAIGEFSDLEGQNYAPQQECKLLQAVMGETPAVWVKWTQMGQLDDGGDKLLFGQLAENKIENSCKSQSCPAAQQKSNSQVPKAAETKAVESLQTSQPSILPLCLAVRPCSVNNPEGTFGDGVSFGVFFGGLEVPVFPKPPLNFKFHGIAASTFGDLTPLTFGAELWGKRTLKGAHLHIEWEINSSLGFKNFKLGSISLNVKSQIYGEIDGNPDAGKLVSGLLSSDSDIASPFSSSLLSTMKPRSALFQIGANADLLLTLKLHEIFKLKGIQMEVPMTLGSASFMLEYKYIKNNKAQSWIDCRFSIASDVQGGIKKGLQSFLDGKGLGFFMTVLNTAIDTFLTPDRSPMSGKIMLRVYGDETFDFGLDVSLNFLTGGISWCGPFPVYVAKLLKVARDFLDWVKHVGATVVEAVLPGLGNKISEVLDPIIDSLQDVEDFIKKVCYPDNPPRMKIAFLKNKFSLEDACLIIGGNQLCLDAIPTCEGPSENGEKCSENEDCTSGYCKNSDDFWTSVACLGTCIEKLDDGADCSDSALHQFTGPFSAEDEACKSGKCYCGKCTNTRTSGLSNGSTCSENSDCESGYCMGWTNVACRGVCTPKQPVGGCCSVECAQDFFAGAAFSAADPYCESNRCICSTCADNRGKLPYGENCATDDNCKEGSCLGKIHGCDGRCRYEWKFVMDMVNQDRSVTNDELAWFQESIPKLMDPSTAAKHVSKVIVEFYFDYNGKKREVHVFSVDSLTGESRANALRHGPSAQPKYIVVKALSFFSGVHIDQAGFDSNGKQEKWWGGEKGNSYSFGAYHAWGPCLKFSFESQLASYVCGEFAQNNFDAEKVRAKWIGE